jgi:uncharacterized membrane protein YoaK (UPF0700 family)
MDPCPRCCWREAGWTDPRLLRRAMAGAAFAVGALCGGLLILNLGVAVALSFGLAIIIAVMITAHRPSRTSTSWSEPPAP